MKKYVTPDLKALAFVAEEAISNDLGGNLSAADGNPDNLYNDKDFGDLMGGQLNG